MAGLFFYAVYSEFVLSHNVISHDRRYIGDLILRRACVFCHEVLDVVVMVRFFCSIGYNAIVRVLITSVFGDEHVMAAIGYIDSVYVVVTDILADVEMTCVLLWVRSDPDAIASVIGNEIPRYFRVCATAQIDTVFGVTGQNVINHVCIIAPFEQYPVVAPLSDGTISV